MAANQRRAHDGIAARLDDARHDLLDIGLRNTLLNYRPLKSRGVEVVGESPAEVFRLLVREGRLLEFQPAPEQTPLHLGPAGAPTVADIAARQRDRKLQTAVPEAQLQARLLNTYLAARTYIEEQGVNILYLALGMLEWYEADTSEERRRAPLLLVPATLERSNARDRFHLTWSGEDVGANLSLAAMLAATFGITAPPLPEAEDIDVDAYFAACAHAVAARPRWSVDRAAVVLGFFSFGKFLMYRDLDPANWSPDTHTVVRALLGEGFREPASQLGDDDFIDYAVQPGDLREVVDADSSQTLAILDARAGRNLVIQGPPGTGKSQTITNLIAESIAAGRTVLFVAEKLAALEVVKRRLDAIGLGDACLELHSHKINKRAVLDELRRTLELGRPRVGADNQHLILLTEARDRLNAYCAAVNQPVGASGVTPYRALGELERIRQDPASGSWPRLEVPGIAHWSAIDAASREAMVAELQARLQRMGVPVEHPFWGVRLSMVVPTDEERLRRLVGDALDAETGLHAAGATLAGLLGLPEPANREEARGLVAGTRRLLEAPDLADVDVAAPDWLDARADLQALLEAGATRTDVHTRRDGDVIPEAWGADLLSLRRDLIAYQHAWWRLLSGTYRAAKRTLAGYCTSRVPATVAEQVALVDDLLNGQRADAAIQALEAQGRRLFRSLWAGPVSDWPRLAELADWLARLHEDARAGQLPSWSIAVIAAQRATPALADATDALEQALDRAEARIDALVAAFAFDAERRFGAGQTFALRPFAERRALLESWAGSFQRLNEMTRLNVSEQACREAGLAPLVDAATHWRDAGTCLVGLLRRTWYEALLDRAFRERSALATFDGSSHGEVVARFRRLDALQLEINRALLAQRHWNALPRSDAGGQIAVLRREFQKRARHLPVRQLMLRAGNAIQAIKPVFMMSPLSIATYLPPNAATFDLVVFDEASQVRPVDAFGALLRAKQAVVVGDDKQLPPTSFFDVLTQSDGAEAPDDALTTLDYQSILNTFLAQSAPKRMLRWHYRSRHESLITVSNHEFYEDRLVVFPCPDPGREGAGLVFRHLPHTTYERGRSRTNREEASIIARAVLEHAAKWPHLTLGVASFSVAQTQAIVDEVERLRREHPETEAFFQSHPHEPFFIKNLENVQGDERDVIFISVGYGRTAEGYVSMHFGPLNAKGGERRLNVLITRARLRCVVFSNLTDDDIDLARSDAAGVRALKRFLRYARTGNLDVPVDTGRAADSPFEEAVEASLKHAGYAVRRQVGSAGFFIDLAVVDPDQPGRYVLGIECDGATYHSARSARDRDRLRQAMLEQLGWRIHRIWSTDWFRNPDAELRRAVAAIEASRAGGRAPHAPHAPAATTIERTNAPPQIVAPSLPPYTVARLIADTRGLDLHDVPPSTLVGWVAQVVAVESPVHTDEVIRRIARAAGAARTGNRIQRAISHAIARAAKEGKVVNRDGFLWSPTMKTPTVRDRSTLDGPGRDLAMVAPEEIALAIVKVVRDAHGIDRAEVAPAVARLFGFQRLTESMRSEIDPLINRLLAVGRLTEQAGHLRVTVSS